MHVQLRVVSVDTWISGSQDFQSKPVIDLSQVHTEKAHGHSKFIATTRRSQHHRLVLVEANNMALAPKRQSPVIRFGIGVQEGPTDPNSKILIDNHNTLGSARSISPGAVPPHNPAIETVCDPCDASELAATETLAGCSGHRCADGDCDGLPINAHRIVNSISGRVNDPVVALALVGAGVDERAVNVFVAAGADERHPMSGLTHLGTVGENLEQLRVRLRRRAVLILQRHGILEELHR